MLNFRPLEKTDSPLLLTWLSRAHVKQWWDDGDNTLEKVEVHCSADKSDGKRFILMGSIDSDERSIGWESGGELGRTAVRPYNK